MVSINLEDIGILSIHGVDYHFNIYGNIKNDAVNFLQNANLNEKRNVIKIKIITMFKMGKEIVTFGDIEVEKHKFHQHKKSVLIEDVNINKIIVPNKVLLGNKDFKYFISYKDDRKIRPSGITLVYWVHTEVILMKLNIW